MMLQRIGVDPADLMTNPADRPPAPTLDAYIPEVEKALTPDTAKTYSAHWNRIRTKRVPADLPEPTATSPTTTCTLVTADRQAALHFDLAGAYGQANGVRDAAAIRHLNRADRLAPSGG